MKTLYLAVWAFGIAILATGCLNDTCERTHTYVQYDPVIKPLEDLRKPVEVSASRELQNPGKIYYYNGYLLINERREGVHIIDNSNPATPENVAFIEIPGNLDMAVKDGILYADMYLDLVAVDISNPLQAAEVGRTPDIFTTFYPFQDGLGYIVDYVPTEQTVEIDCDDEFFGQPWFWRGDVIFFDMALASAEVSGAFNSGGAGIGGSMARFTIAKDHLYTLDDARMHVFDVSQPTPSLQNTVDVSWGIETLFPYKDYLFIGANAGMFVFDNTNPLEPVFVSEFNHARACDPVFVSDDVAFVTLRNGNGTCETFTNQLDVIDVSDIHNLSLIRSYPMHNPHGLSVVDETLYLCEGTEGLKIFSTEELTEIDKNLLDHVRNLHGYDVIVLPPGDLVMVIGEDGLYQFDATDRSDLSQISKITVYRQ